MVDASLDHEDVQWIMRRKSLERQVWKARMFVGSVGLFRIFNICPDVPALE